MTKPVILINFKTYPNSTGQNAVHLAKICEKIAYETASDIRIAVSAPDIYHVSEVVSIPVYAEHVDEYPLGKSTGAILPEIVKTAGATGTLLNHSEHRIPFSKLKDCIIRAKAVSLTIVACAQNTEEAIKISDMKPDFIAIEPPELIGGNITVSTAEPGVIIEGVREIKEKRKTKLLVGAGIRTRADVVKAIELGADGVLIASGVDLSDNPEETLNELLP